MKETNGKSLTTSQTGGQRVKWLDSIRGVAFLMVIYSHLEYCDESIMRFFTPVFLTSFFFVSGYLFKEGESFFKVFEQRTRTLLLPFLVFGFAMIGMSQVLSFNEHVTLTDSIKGLLFQNGQHQILWFVAALYVYSIVFYWVEKACPNVNWLLFAGLGLFVLNTIYSHWLKLPSFPWHIASCGFACFYMALGKWFRHNEGRVMRYFNWRNILLAAVAYIGAIVLTNRSCNFSGDSTLVFSLAVTLLGLFVMIALNRQFDCKSRLVLFVGANSLFYFAFHGKVFSLLQTVIAKLFTNYGWEHSLLTDDLLGFLIVFLDAVILILPCMFVNKFMPWTTGKGFQLWKC